MTEPVGAAHDPGEAVLVTGGALGPSPPITGIGIAVPPSVETESRLEEMRKNPKEAAEEVVYIPLVWFLWFFNF